MKLKSYRNSCIILTLITMTSCFLFAQQPPAPPTEVRAFDTPNDDGRSITVKWKLSADDGSGAENVIGYDILRSTMPDGEFTEHGSAPTGMNMFKDKEIEKDTKYYYVVSAKDIAGNKSDSTVVGPARATAQWFHTGKKFILLAVILLTGIIVYTISQAKKGKELFVRSIAGIEAVDEAIGRATEMGRPILYVPGIGEASNIATIAAMNILGMVARRTAEYDTRLIVPCRSPVVMNILREIVKTAYMSAGHPDAYQPDDVFYVTATQFAYTAAVNGIMLREQPAAIFLQGLFFAESLILAETGHSVGAIQIAGTDADAQLPFFIVACDYTLIGEEFYAASAYLSKNPLLLGSLKGQDWGKALIIAALILGLIFELIGIPWFTQFFARP